MAFVPEEVDLTVDLTVDFTTVPDNTVKWVQGKGQWVYWKGCNVTVFEKDSEGNRREKVLDILTGRGMVSPGTQLYCFKGKVKEL